MNIIQAIDHPDLLLPCFVDKAANKSVETWRMWRMVLSSLFAIPLTQEERVLFTSITGRDAPPTAPVREAWFIAGRRSGKSFISSLIAVYLACFVDYRKYLAPGEYATIMLLAADRAQARTLIQHVKGLIHKVPALREMIEFESKESITLNNRVVIEIGTAGFRAVRGYTLAACVADEIAFWRSEDSASPDHEVLAALRPALLTIPTSKLICISSPYRRSGALWEAYRDHYGQESDVLVLKAASNIMNPSLPQAELDKAYARDAAVASAEYGAEFRTDVSGFLDSDWIDRAASMPNGELPSVPGVRYYGFVDPSGGRVDSMTMGIAHTESSGQAVLDVICGRTPPFEPSSVVLEFATLLKRYGLTEAKSDRYGGEWVTAEFRKVGIELMPSEKSKSEIYLEVGPVFAQGAVSIPNHPRLVSELRQLERRTARGGRDSVDHPQKAHDDYANAAAGALWMASQPQQMAEIRIRRL